VGEETVTGLQGVSVDDLYISLVKLASEYTWNTSNVFSPAGIEVREPKVIVNKVLLPTTIPPVIAGELYDADEA